MEERPNSKRLSLGAIAGITIAALILGGGAGFWAYRTLTASKTQPTPTVSEPTPSSTAQETRAYAYWLEDTGKQMKLVPSAVKADKSASTQEVLKTAFDDLLAGSSKSSASTAIPEGTKLLGLTEQKDGVHLNLSKEFTTGGGSTSMTGRLAQIIYTATSADPKSPVWIDVEGKPLELLGEGEGLMVDQPITRQLFEENFEL